MSEITEIVVQDPKVPQTLFDMAPAQMVAHASEMATVLADIIRKRKLYTNIQGKDHVRLEGWTTLGSMLGLLPREKYVNELADGSYEAYVELYSLRSGQIVGGASALCSVDERRWKSADKYARRSMAVTRATGKAYRLGLGWVMTLAGYEVTPAEEMPDQKAKPTPYDPNNITHAEALENLLTRKNVPKEHWQQVSDKLKGKPSSDLNLVLVELGL